MTDSCCRSVQRTAQRVVWAVVVLAAGTAAALAQQKAPVPDDAAQAKARELIRQIYGPQHDEAKNSVEKTALAKKMLNEAADDRDDPANHFVLLQVARDMAVQAADANTAMAAVDQIARTYQVDAPAMKVETLFQTAANASLSEQRKAVARAAIPLIRAAREEDDYETANRLVRKALDLARRARDGALLKQMVAINKQVGESAQAYAEVAKAEAVLADNPTDPEANLAVGRYLCLTKRDWEKGIAMLALGSDAHLKALAVKELEGAASAGEQVALGDAWWDLAQTRRGKEEESLLPRAGSWYRLAQPSVAGLVKVKIDRRLEEIGRMRMPIPDMPTQPLLPNGWVIGRPVNLGPTVNGRSDDAGPALSSDGLTLFFSSNRPGGKGRADLWMCTRASSDGPFDRAVNLGPTVNSSSHEARPALFSDGLALLFFSERSGGQGSRDLWMCTRESSDGPFGRPVNLGPTVNSSREDGGPALFSDGLTLLFHSSRSGGKGRADLWMCRRAALGEPFGRPVNLGPTVNSSRDDVWPALSADGLTLFFSSDRPGGQGGSDLWMARIEQ